MNARINLFAAPQDAVNAVIGLQNYVNECGLEGSLMELVKIRASRINGCAFCLDMQMRDSLKEGETVQRIFCSMPGPRHRCIPNANGPRCCGPRA